MRASGKCQRTRIDSFVGAAIVLVAVPAFGQQPAPAPAQPPGPAQPAPAHPVVPAPAAPAPAAPAAPVQPAPAPAEEPPPAVEPAPPAAPEVPAPPAEPEVPPAPHVYVEEAPAAAAWYDAIELGAFVDAYFSVNYNMPKPQLSDGELRAFDAANGLSLAWAGIDASYPADPVGATVSLRFGPSAVRLASGCLGEGGLGGTPFAGAAAVCDDSYGVGFVEQAFVSWKPGGAASALRLDFGKFNTIFGAEVAESQNNLNYTRGFLYWLAQPAFHTGLRLSADLADAFSLNALAVNGINNTIDNNAGKTFGVQGVIRVPRGADADLLSVAAGYLIGPERDDYQTIICGPDEAFDAGSPTGCVSEPGSAGGQGTVDRASANTEGLRHLVDVVVTLDPIDKLHLVLNGDFGVENLRRSLNSAEFQAVQWWGVMAGARLGVSDAFGVGARGEYLHDDDGHVTGNPGHTIDLVSATLTLDYSPLQALLIRLDNRLDWSSKEIFPKAVRDLTGYQFTTTLGVVATTD
jgi:hypothetical protein